MARSTAHTHGLRRRYVAHDDYDDDRVERVERVERRDVRYERFGGLNFGAAFFGWIVASGIGIMLIALLAAAGSAVALTSIANNGVQNITNGISSGTVTTVGLVSGALLLIALAISYFAGGYVAGRMSRYDGARQGFGVWIIGLLVTLLLAGLGAVFGAKYNILQGLNLPHLPIGSSVFTSGGLIATALILLATLGAAILGGKTGENYHHKVDEVQTAN